MRIVAIILLLTCSLIGVAEPPVKSPWVYRRFASLIYDNDFFTATDRYYTQGLRFEFSSVRMAQWPTRHILMRLQYAIPVVSLRISQDCYTPSSIRMNTIQSEDRPFAGVLMASVRSDSRSEIGKKILISEFGIGVMGPCAGCEAMQTGIHAALDNIEPLGWEYQLEKAIAVQYTVDLEKTFLFAHHAGLSYYGRVRAGTIHDDIELGARLRFGHLFDTYGRLDGNYGEFHWDILCAAGARVVGYDATLQGSMFASTDVHTLNASEIERVVLTGGINFRIEYKRIELGYHESFFSPKFDTGDLHRFGGFWARLFF